MALSRMVGDGSKSMTVVDDDVMMVRCNDARDEWRYEKALMDGSPLVVIMAMMDVVVSLMKKSVRLR